MSRFYTVDQYDQVQEVIPAVKLKRSDCVDFRGWAMETPDHRSLPELQKQPLVLCLQVNEGGSGRRFIPGSSLFGSAQEAQAHIGRQRAA